MTATLTIGMPCYDDYPGVWATVQSLREDHEDLTPHCHLIVVDNHPDSRHGEMVRGFLKQVEAGGDFARVEYVEFSSPVGPAGAKDAVFRYATTPYVLCMDSHLHLHRRGLPALFDYYRQHPDTRDLIQGPLVYNDRRHCSTHFEDVWRGDMRGIWATRPSLDVHSPEFRDEPQEIPAQGMGLFSCRRDAWVGFNPRFTHFGGEELYVHDKVRRRGGRVICLPWLRWLHRFGKISDFPMPSWNRWRNYVIGHAELGTDLERMRRHYVDGVNEDGSPWGDTPRISPAQWAALTRDPSNPPPHDPTQPRPARPQQQPQRVPDHLPAQQITLEAAYQHAARVKSDINEHVPRLKELASQCETVVEFGTRRGVSTIALMAGQPKRLVSYDTRPVAGVAEALGQKAGEVQFEFRQGDSLQVDIEECDLLFIDTIHTAKQLAGELARHAGRVRHWIALHDTTTYGPKGEDGGLGLHAALREFLAAHPDEWFVAQHFANNHGFTVLSREPKDRPATPICLWPVGHGPGTQLKAILKSIGVNPSPSCDCNGKALIMDCWGVEVCRQRRDEIVKWLREGSDRWTWTQQLAAAAKAVATGLAFRLNWADPYPSLVDEAIRRAEAEELKATTQEPKE